MIDINEDKPSSGDMVLAAFAFDKDTKSFSEGIELFDIDEWAPDENGKGGIVTHTIFTRTSDGLFAVTPLQWRPEYADLVSHWTPYPEHPRMVEQYVTFNQLSSILRQMRKSVSLHAPCENQYEEDAHTSEPQYSTSTLWEMIFDELEEKVSQLERETVASQ